MANYFLSLKRKNPTDDTTMLNTEIIPSQLVFVYSKVGFQSAYIFFASKYAENDSPCKRFKGFSVQNSLKKNFLLNSKPNPYTLIKMSTNEPTATITNIFWRLFISQFNTVPSIIVVTQVLLEYFMLMDKVNKVGRPQVEQSSVRSVRLPVRIWNKVYGASKDFRSVNEYLLSLVENDLIKKKDLKKSERRSPVTSTKRSQ